MGKMVYNTIESKLERKRTMSEPLVNVTRGPIVESVHYGDIAVVDYTGRLLAFAGDPYRVTYLRSAAKPLQALNVLLSGAADRFAFTDEELAIMCASHYGEDYHQKVIQGILEKLGLALSDLKCGAPYSISPWVYEQQLRDHVQLDTWNCDCSGKHAGFLATCLTKGYPLENYDRPEHPLQREVLKLVAHMCGVEPDSIYIGEDGCGVPVHGLRGVKGRKVGGPSHHDNLQRRVCENRRVGLGNIRRQICQLPGGKTGGLPAIHPDAAAADGQRPQKQTEQSGLPAAVGTDDSRHSLVKLQHCPVRKTLEALQLNAFEKQWPTS